MPLSRRHFLRRVPAGVAAGAVLIPTLSEAAASAAANALATSEPILLNSNENPYGPFPSVQAAMEAALRRANRYPDHQYRELVNRIASYNSVAPEQVILGIGSTEILKMAADAFTGPDRPLILADPTFEAIAWYAEKNGAPVIKVPLTSDYAHDLEAMVAKAPKAGALIYLCNPNNPTASLTPASKIEAFVNGLPPNVTVLIDEAYHHFAMGAPQYRSFLDGKNPRVIVARTFSKVYALAGMRLGYAVSTADTVKQLRSYQTHDNINIAAASCGTVALDDDQAMRAAVARNAADRDAFLRQAQSRGLKVIPSYANFAMFDAGHPVKQVIAYFEQQNIRIGRPFPPYDSKVRITFGKPAEMAAFWTAWDGFSSAKAAASHDAAIYTSHRLFT
jgi:histidinol-phosphate aminotransferase